MSVGSAAMAIGGVGLGLSTRSYGQVLSANDEVRVGIVGFFTAKLIYRVES